MEGRCSLAQLCTRVLAGDLCGLLEHALLEGREAHRPTVDHGHSFGGGRVRAQLRQDRHVDAKVLVHLGDVALRAGYPGEEDGGCALLLSARTPGRLGLSLERETAAAWRRIGHASMRQCR